MDREDMQNRHKTNASAAGPTVVVRLGGGLGNQLFQYAFGRRLSLVNHAALVLDASGYRSVRESDAKLGIRALGLAHFNIQGALDLEGPPGWSGAPTLPERPWIRRKSLKWRGILARFIEARKPYTLRRLIKEPESMHFTFDRRVYRRAIKGTVVLEGYWQTERYFIDVEPAIRQDLTLKDALQGANEVTAMEILATNSVSVHVRHGDNMTVATALGLLPREYYLEAISGLLKDVSNPHFFVFSDEVPWARDMLALPYPTTYVDDNVDTRNYEDLRLMSFCKHHIIANSTFGWWGAWLGKKESQIVYAPRRYWQNLDRPNPDLYPDAWRVI